MQKLSWTGFWRMKRMKWSRTRSPTGHCLLILLWFLPFVTLFSALDLCQSAKKAPPARLTVLEAFQQKKSRLFLKTQGTVIKLLADDRQGSRHQKFLIKTDEGPTLLISHNIDLSERVPLKHGTQVRIRGEYIWNTKGGLMHWTHRDPQGRHEGGWIKIMESGRVYQ
jgi:uncharacterized protein DUF3465